MQTKENVKNIISLIGKTDITELIWEQDGLRIDISRELSPPAEVKAEESRPVAGNTPQAAATNPVIDAPIVGTFYSTHPKSKQVYALRGLKVDAGQVVGVIEAMKVYREVFSPFSGIIVDILVADGQPVMYAQGLIELRQNLA